jgi:PQQ-like domain
VHRYDGPTHHNDNATALDVAPDGTMVFVTGSSNGDFETIAYDASTGAPVWRRRSSGPANGHDFANALRVSPDGSTVFVTGASRGSGSGSDYATIAYAATTGTMVWLRRYDGPAGGSDEASSVAVSPDSATVFVTGSSAGTNSDGDYATIAYDASTGKRLWLKRYNGPGNWFDVAHALAVAPDGSTLFVTGASAGRTQIGDYATIAYGASTGAKLWVKRYNGPAHDDDYATALRVSPNGSRLFVTGYSSGSSGADFATFAYRTSDGTRLWRKRYNGPGDFFDFARDLRVSPDGSTVFVTGESFVSLGEPVYATLAYDAATGSRLWRKQFRGPAGIFDDPRTLSVTPDGSSVFVTGASRGAKSGYDYATVGYDASDGTKLSVHRYDGPASEFDAPEALGISPDGSKLFVTGASYGSTSTKYDYATIAYNV